MKHNKPIADIQEFMNSCKVTRCDMCEQEDMCFFDDGLYCCPFCYLKQNMKQNMEVRDE